MANILKERAARVEDAYRLLQGNKDGLGNIPGVLRQLISLKVWEGYDWRGKEVKFTTFREFVETPPPQGLGTTIEELINFCKKYPEIADLVDQTVQEQMPDYQPPAGGGIIYPLHKARGTSFQRSLRRLRNLSETDSKAALLRKKVLSGEISANHALLELGTRKKRFAVEASPDALVEFMKKHLTPTQRKKIVDAIKLIDK